MAPFFIFIVVVLISTFMRGLERAETRKRTVKPRVVGPTAKPNGKAKRSNVEPDRVLPTVKVEDRKPSSAKAASVQREKPHLTSSEKMTKKSVLNGMIMAEILSPPKCKRR